jgi:nucleoside-diphosphate kinase
MLQKTFVLIKHDGIQRGLVGEILKRFEQKGMKIIGLKLLQPTKEIAEKHYVITEAWVKKLAGNTRAAAEAKGKKISETDEQIAKRVHSWNVKYLTEGPVIAIALEGFHAIEIVRKIVGHAEARQAAIGTIRGDFALDSYDLADAKQRSIRNIIHASGSKEEAEHELSIWFKKEELLDYEHHEWKIMH